MQPVRGFRLIPIKAGYTDSMEVEGRLVRLGSDQPPHESSVDPPLMSSLSRTISRVIAFASVLGSLVLWF